VTNGLAYYPTVLIMGVKRFLVDGSVVMDLLFMSSASKPAYVVAT
jgi:hypothetical protein